MKEKWGRLLMCLYLHGIMDLMIVCISRAGFVSSKGHFLTLFSPHDIIEHRYLKYIASPYLVGRSFQKYYLALDMILDLVF